MNIKTFYILLKIRYFDRSTIIRNLYEMNDFAIRSFAEYKSENNFVVSLK